MVAGSDRSSYIQRILDFVDSEFALARMVKIVKFECTSLISIPLNFKAMRYELALFFWWYNELRPHKYLGSRTPIEVYNHSPPSEPPLKLVHASEIPELELHVSYLDDMKHLPIIDIKKAA